MIRLCLGLAFVDGDVETSREGTIVFHRIFGLP